ncbi:DNA (cytosine-5-)-methyltransferase [Pontibacter qinzhouensis]|uniref:Cytosine-specific methyltransferase n=1 Tax=Pontibacter qinzhouensis TaxID=2603253 RepID=A0A5C8KD46_9BACT|nr:DNA (cytosine-5-)-methyltransferase [Pontibacter qinzhouensis]
MSLTHGSLFSGIGGFEIGAAANNISTIWNCEIDSYNRKILKQHFPNTIQHEDIRELRHPSAVDIISGGFPCQDLSIAGRGRGITGERSGLWSEMLRIIDEGRPAYVVIENSPELLKKGFENVLYPLSEIGYDAEWQCLSGTTFGVQQGRERVYCIAHTNGIGQQGERQKPIFSEPELSRQFQGVHPGWRTRSDIPKPRAFRSLNDIPNGMERTKAHGNAIMPIVASYLFRCIVNHYNQITP